MAVQTVVTSYPPSPMNSSAGNSFVNLDTSLNPQLVNLPGQTQVPATSASPPCSNTLETIPPAVIVSSSAPPPVPSLIQVKDVTSLSHSITSSAAVGKCPASELSASTTSVPLRSGSPQYLPDSTAEDLGKIYLRCICEEKLY